MTDAEEKKTDNWAEMSDGEEHDQEEEAEAVESKPKKFIPPPKKGTKNKQGDYVVTKLDIPDFRDGVKERDENNEDDDSSSDEGYGDEDDTNNTKPVETAAVEGKLQSILFLSFIKINYLVHFQCI